MYLALCNSLVREHVERLRDEASRARLAARVERGPGVWATVRGALAARRARDGAAADDAA
ncbi:MAG TPA: hypothetical protein VK066_11855 [Chloroflexota bacterium]|nr:hypothetical protein [Chloroflexota bacterium]